MVLKFLVTVVLVFLVTGFGQLAWAFDSNAYNVALAQARKAMSRKDWRDAEQIADAALHAQDHNWPPSGTITEDFVKKLKGRPNSFFALVSLSADAKSHIFILHDESMTDDERSKMKAQIKAYTDVLAQSGVSVEEAEKIQSRVQDQEQLATLEEYKLSLGVLLGYSTWEDRIYFKTSIPTHAILFVPSIGLALNYTNAFYDWSGGVSYGIGDGELKFSDNSFDDHPKVTVVSGFASGLIQIHDSAAAFGAEVAARSVNVNGHNADGSTATTSPTELSALAVGRFRVSKLDLKFKGGMILGNPSALWAVEFGYPLYLW